MNLKVFGGRTTTLFVSLLIAAGVTACAPGPVAPSPATVPTAAVAASTPVITQATSTSGPTAASTTAPTALLTAAPTAGPTKASVAAATPTAQAVPTNTAAAGQSTVKIATTKINLNTATEADFLKVPGVGSKMVREFMEYRPYTSIQQFAREIGKYVDAQQVTEYQKYVYVPISVNKSDAATLQQIPGLNANAAAALIAARPYASNDAFLAKLTEYVSPTEAVAAAAYLSNP